MTLSKGFEEVFGDMVNPEFPFITTLLTAFVLSKAETCPNSQPKFIAYDLLLFQDHFQIPDVLVLAPMKYQFYLNTRNQMFHPVYSTLPIRSFACSLLEIILRAPALFSSSLYM